jgi:flagellar motor switch protein FliN
MTEASAPALSESAQLLEAWSESLTQVLGQISGSPQPCTVLGEAPTALPGAVTGDLWIACVCSGGLRGEMSLRVSAGQAIRLAQILMGEPQAPATDATPELTNDQREAALELFRQVAGLVASQLKPRWGDVQQAIESAPSAPSWPASATSWIRAGEEASVLALIEVHLSAALVASLRVEKAEAAPKPAVAQSPAQQSPPISPQDGSVKLDLLMDVQLAITLRFGSRRLELREILDLNSGSVIDLDRQVQEPVDVLVDGRIVARGEVVVINGNYGIRITEVGPAART